MTVEEFIQALAHHQIHLTPKQIQQFETYYDLLVEWNQKMNLTAITDRQEVYLKHFYDSLMPLWMMPQENYAIKLCDVGAGAGFPSIPLKIIHPEIDLTIIDSLNKRISFLEYLGQALDLDNFHCVHGRAEELGQNKAYRGQFDLVTARAVAALNVLAEYCLPFSKIGGYFLALKGANAQVEIQAAKKAIAVLGAKLEKETQANLPIEASERSFILIRKTKETPNRYPRRPGTPAKKPIK